MGSLGPSWKCQTSVEQLVSIRADYAVVKSAFVRITMIFGCLGPCGRSNILCKNVDHYGELGELDDQLLAA